MLKMDSRIVLMVKIYMRWKSMEKIDYFQWWLIKRMNLNIYKIIQHMRKTALKNNKLRKFQSGNLKSWRRNWLEVMIKETSGATEMEQQLVNK